MVRIGTENPLAEGKVDSARAGAAALLMTESAQVLKANGIGRNLNRASKYHQQEFVGKRETCNAINLMKC